MSSSTSLRLVSLVSASACALIAFGWGIAAWAGFNAYENFWLVLTPQQKSGVLLFGTTLLMFAAVHTFVFGYTFRRSPSPVLLAFWCSVTTAALSLVTGAPALALLFQAKEKDLLDAAADCGTRFLAMLDKTGQEEVTRDACNMILNLGARNGAAVFMVVYWILQGVLIFSLFKYNHLAEREEAKNRSHAVMIGPGRYAVQKELGDV